MVRKVYDCRSQVRVNTAVSVISACTFLHAGVKKVQARITCTLHAIYWLRIFNQYCMYIESMYVLLGTYVCVQCEYGIVRLIKVCVSVSFVLCLSLSRLTEKGAKLVLGRSPAKPANTVVSED